MRTRVPASRSPAVAAAFVLVGLVTLVGCVPEPANRATSSGSVALATLTPEPTPAGPTPTPSFVRPTPTPQPTFFIYTVVRGDTLSRIAKVNGTNGRSIAYWNRLRYPSLDPDSGSYRPNYLVVGWKLQLIPNTVVDPEDLPPGPPTPSPDLSVEPDDTPDPGDPIPPDPDDPEASAVPSGG